MDRWYMVFDEDPHGNRDIPFYFLRKMYAEFILQKHVNYFDILDFQGVGHGMPQDRQGARTDPNRIRRPPRTPNPPRVYPPAGSVIVDTQEALFDLTDTLLQHGTAVERNVGEGVGPPDVEPSRAGPSKTVPSRDRPSGSGAGSSQDTGTAHQVLGHPCTTCGNLCYGPSSDFRTDGLLQFVSKTPSSHSLLFLYQNFHLFHLNYVYFHYLTIYVFTHLQLVSNVTPTSDIGVDAPTYDIGTSPLHVRTISFLIYHHVLNINSREAHNTVC
jgi:hypothetical protein